MIQVRRVLTDADVAMIKVFGDGTGASAATVAKEYGVHPQTVKNIWSGRSWHQPSQKPRKDRLISDEEVREMRRLHDTGMGEHAIKSEMGVSYSRSTIRQVILRHTYLDVE